MGILAQNKAALLKAEAKAKAAAPAPKPPKKVKTKVKAGGVLAANKRQQSAKELEAEKASNADQIIIDSLDRDCLAIKALKQGPKRLALKQECIEKYLGKIDAFQKATSKRQFPAITQVMVWAFDIVDISLFAKMAELALATGQEMPPTFKKDLKVFVADAVLELARTAFKGDLDKEEAIASVKLFSSYFEQVMDWDVHAVIKARYLQMTGDFAFIKGEFKTALELFKQIPDYDTKEVGYKTRIKNCEKKLAKS